MKYIFGNVRNLMVDLDEFIKTGSKIYGEAAKQYMMLFIE